MGYLWLLEGVLAYIQQHIDGLPGFVSCGIHRQFFLGERVQAQTTGIRVVLHPPPFDMRRELAIGTQDAWFGGSSVDHLVDREADHDIFYRDFLSFNVTSGVD